MTRNLIFTHLEAITGPLVIFVFILSIFLKAFHIFFNCVLWQYLGILKTNHNAL